MAGLTEGAPLRRKGIIAIVALAAIAMLVVGVGTAFAAKSYSTKILVVQFSGTANDGLLDGALQTNAKCLGPRLMQVSKKAPSGFKAFDQDYSSAHGAWAFRGQFGPFPSTVKIQVAKAKLRNRRGEVVGVCKPDSVTLNFSSAPTS
jgi:hypothetical protein